MAIYVGISGFRYPHWRGVFYPRGLPQRLELAYAAERFGSIEINGSFYSLQRPEYYRAWREQLPRGYVLAVKGGRFITHMKKLRDVQVPLANFFASGPLCLGEGLGPVLWQFPENMPCELTRFEQFFALLPRSTRAAAELARSCASRGDLSALPGPRSRSHPLRHAVELRNPRCFDAPFRRLLQRAGIAWVIAETAGRFPYLEQVKADFVYIRLHGDTQLYASGYRAPALQRWAERIARLSTGRDVYVYFDNDGSAHAPHDALALQTALERRGCTAVRPHATAQLPA